MKVISSTRASLHTTTNVSTTSDGRKFERRLAPAIFP